MLPYEHLRWIENTEEDFDYKKLMLTSDTRVVQDFRDQLLLLFTSPWNITWALEHNEGLKLAEFSENALNKKIPDKYLSGIFLYFLQWNSDNRAGSTICIRKFGRSTMKCNNLSNNR